MKILFFLFPVMLSAQIAFRSPDGLTILAPPPAFGVTTIYDYVVTDGSRQWSQNTYQWKASIPVGSKKCKIYILVREYINQVQTNRKMYIFYEK